MLDNALDIGITEKDFWDMTIGELDRKIASYKRITLNKAKDKALFDYSLAILIGRAFNVSQDNPFPTIYEAYPSIFEDDIKRIEEEKQRQQAQLSVLRFIQFAESFNKKFTEETN